MFDLRLCTTSLTDFVDALRALRAGDDALKNRRLQVSVTLEGLMGPRCEMADPGCSPVPYTKSNQSPPPEQRMPVDPAALSSPGALRLVPLSWALQAKWLPV